MKILYCAMAVAAAAALAAPALATPNSVLSIKLGQQNNSNQNGTATVKDVSGGVLVKVSVQNEPKGASEPSHIHPGTCAKLNPAPWKVLNNVVNGTAVTTVKGITVADLKKGQYAINVHDASNYTRYVSCGDL
jgi:Cu/Zn superoxide dismutase